MRGEGGGVFPPLYFGAKGLGFIGANADAGFYNRLKGASGGGAIPFLAAVRLELRARSAPQRVADPVAKKENGRGERIRTSGPCLPKTVLYQAELLPDRMFGARPTRETGGGL